MPSRNGLPVPASGPRLVIRFSWRHVAFGQAELSDLARLFETAAKAQTRIMAVDIQKPSLKAVFLPLTGRALWD